MRSIFISIAFIFIASAVHAEGMQRYVESFNKEPMHSLVVEHCKQFSNQDKCLDRQFNCLVESDRVKVSKEVARKTARDAATFNRKGEPVSFNWCEAKRKGQIFKLQEKVEDMPDRYKGYE